MRVGYNAGSFAVTFATGEAPTVTMQPTGLILAMGVAAQRLHSSASIATQSGGKLAANDWITSALEIDEPRAA